MREINLIRDRKSDFYLKKKVELKYYSYDPVDLKIDTKIYLKDINFIKGEAFFRVSSENNFDEYIKRKLKNYYDSDKKYKYGNYEGYLLIIDEWTKNPDNFILTDKTSDRLSVFENKKLILTNYQYIGTGCGSNTYYPIKYYQNNLSIIKEKMLNYPELFYDQKDYKEILKNILKDYILIKFDDLDEYVSTVSRKQHRENVFKLLE